MENVVLIAVLILFLIIVMIDPEKKTLNDKVRRDLGKKTIMLTDGSVHYEIAGPKKAPVVVLVHGFSVPSYIWDPTFSVLQQAGFQTLRFDLFGRGYSDRPRVDYDLKLFIRQLKDLMDTLGVEEPVHLIGLSMGGPITAGFTCRYPKKVRSLTLIDPLVSKFSKKKMFLLLMHGIGEVLMAIYGEPFMLPRSQNDDFCKPEKFPGWADKFRVQTRYKGFRRAILSTIRHLVETDMLPDYQALEALNLPVLLFRGAEDGTIPKKDIQLLRNILPRIEFYQIEDAGHIPHYEKPEVVNPILVDFLNKN